MDVALAQLLFLACQTQAQIHEDFTIFTDSQAALKAISGFTIQSGQFLAKKILGKLQKLKENGITCRLQWSPGHEKITGNMEAHRLVQEATKPEALSPTLKNPIMLYSILKQRAIMLVPGPDPKTLFCKAKVGRFIKSIDKALPGKHTRIIYNGRNKKQSQTLCQLRTGICRLNLYLSKIQAADSDQCRCNRGRETVDHFLFRCPRWCNLRQELKRVAGNRWGDLSFMLGGWSNKRKDGPLDKWTPSKAAISTTINFTIATGRLEDCSHDDNEETEDERGTSEEEEDS